LIKICYEEGAGSFCPPSPSLFSRHKKSVVIKN
jgi:hypothetical protein